MNLESMSNVQLVQLYNSKTGENVKRFSDRKTALRRIAALSPTGTASQRKTTKAARAKLESPKKFTRENPRGFNLPKLAETKEPAEGTLRRRVFDAAVQGVTFEAVVDKMMAYDREVGQPTKNPRGRAYKNIRMLHFYAGFGLRTEGGKIYVVR